MIKILGLTWLPPRPDFGLLIFRVAFAALMLVFHGWEKFMTASRQFHTFPDLIGLGNEVSYVLVVWFEVFGAILIALGCFTRFHALGLAFTMFVAWYLFHEIGRASCRERVE